MNQLKKFFRAIPVLLGLVLLGWMAFFHPEWILTLARATALCSVFVLLCVVTPIGGIRLGSDATQSRSKWFCELLLAQGILLILFIAGISAFLGAGPVFAQNQITLQTATETIKSYTLTQWGIFPWSVFIVWTIILAYNTYVQKSGSYFYQNAQNYCPRKLAPFFKNFVGFSVSGANMMAVAFAIAAAALLIGYVVQRLLGAHHFAVSFVTVIVVYAGMLMLALLSKRLLRRISAMKKPMARMGLCYLIAGVGLIALASLGNLWFATNHPEMLSELACQSCQQMLSERPVETRLATLYYSWWLLWLPIAGTYFAKMSAGRTIRELVCGLLVLPVALILLTAIFPAWFDFVVIMVRLLPTNGILIAMGALVTLIIYKLLRGVTSPDWFHCGPMALPSDMKKSRLSLKDGPKTYGLKHYTHRIGTMVLAILLLHAVTGWYGIQFQLSAMAFVTTEVLLVGMLCFILQILQARRLAVDNQA